MMEKDFLEVVGHEAHEFADDVGYGARSAVMHVVGKGSIKLGVPALTTAAGGSVLGDSAKMVAGGLGISAAAVFSSAMVHGDYLHNLDVIRRQYSKEAAATLGKDKNDITVDDLKVIAEGDAVAGIEANPTFSEALDEYKKRRNWGVGISVLSSAAAGLVVLGISDAVGLGLTELPVVGGTIGDISSLLHPVDPTDAAHLTPEAHAHGFVDPYSFETAFGTTSPIALGTAGALSYGTYKAASTSLHWASENMFGVEKRTVNDTIRDIHHDRAHSKLVTQEKIFEAYLEAHPALGENIEATYGDTFKKLNQEQKLHVLGTVGVELGLEKITTDINTNRMRPEELAFAVFGQSSGVKHDEMPQPEDDRNKGIVARAWLKCCNTLNHLLGSKMANDVIMDMEDEEDYLLADPQDTLAARSTAMLQSPDGNSRLEVQTGHDKQDEKQHSFVQMVGKKHGADSSMSFVEKVEHSRSDQNGVSLRT